jgi:hypothetical protein
MPRYICDVHVRCVITTPLFVYVCSEDISPLSSLSRLVFLDLRGNNLATVGALAPLTALPLKTLFLQGNPLCHCDHNNASISAEGGPSIGGDYGREVLAMLQGLERLDQW